jgi:hypothetical protein
MPPREEQSGENCILVTPVTRPNKIGRPTNAPVHQRPIRPQDADDRAVHHSADPADRTGCGQGGQLPGVTVCEVVGVVEQEATCIDGDDGAVWHLVELLLLARQIVGRRPAVDVMGIGCKQLLLNQGGTTHSIPSWVRAHEALTRLPTSPAWCTCTYRMHRAARVRPHRVL